MFNYYCAALSKSTLSKAVWILLLSLILVACGEESSPPHEFNAEQRNMEADIVPASIQQINMTTNSPSSDTIKHSVALEEIYIDTQQRANRLLTLDVVPLMLPLKSA